MPSSAIMFDIKGKNGAKGRAYGDECQVASIGEIAYNKQGLIQYEATIDVCRHWHLPARGDPRVGSGRR